METFTVPSIVVYIAACAGALAGIYKLFERADATSTPEHLAEFGEWLKNLTPRGAATNWPREFAKIFDIVFGTKSFSFRFFRRSAVASTFAVIVLSLLLYSILPEIFVSWRLKQGNLFGLILFLSAFGALLNLIPDYIPLVCTRKLIGAIETNHGFLSVLIVLVVDFILTIFIFGTVVFVVALITGNADMSGTLKNSFELLKTASLVESEIVDEDRLAAIFLYSTFFTSIWLWLTIIGLAGMAFLRRIAPAWDWFQRTRNLTAHPYKSLGFAVNVIVVVMMIGVTPFVFAG